MTTLNSFSNIATYLPRRCNHKNSSLPRSSGQANTQPPTYVIRSSDVLKNSSGFRRDGLYGEKKKKNTHCVRQRCADVRLVATVVITERRRRDQRCGRWHRQQHRLNRIFAADELFPGGARWRGEKVGREIGEN
ncbi:hypothetical protein DEO72_LG10g2434 [Vigna unguiculata]|uniref:Uncharacterized protein n=1 Tax=Vigna unguiculata TaxID=3917 RepID=A0A4D6NEA7_VIGUN|nr:hypothetical protein DEO72_LG10g2434 [Vigna unguiculata]